MPTLDHPANLAAYQRYVAALEEERGFADQSTIEKCLLLGEEVGELFKAVRAAEGVATETGTEISAVADELADVFIMLIAVANHVGIDLAGAFLTKEEQNKSRNWS